MDVFISLIKYRSDQVKDYKVTVEDSVCGSYLP